MLLLAIEFVQSSQLISKGTLEGHVVSFTFSTCDHLSTGSLGCLLSCLGILVLVLLQQVSAGLKVKNTRVLTLLETATGLK
jgi:hypothetical protein